MRQILTDLCAILEEQRDVLKNMLELSKEQRQILISAKSDKLDDVVRLEFKELGKLNAVEKRRLGLMKDVASQMGIAEGELTISAIAQAAAPDEQEPIRELQRELTSIIEEHSAINKENRSLIETHVEYSQMMMELMVGEEDPLNNLYGGDGREAPGRKLKGLYDGHA